MLPAVFIKGHLRFSIDGHQLEYIQQKISVFGVTSLPWAPLEPKDHFGRIVEVTVTIPQPEPWTFKTRAYIMGENTLYSEHMVLKFMPDAEQKAQLSNLISKHGHYPTEYMRKYPRIPSSQAIQTFPLRVVVMPIADPDDPATQSPVPITFDLSNLSPNGILISTENQLAMNLKPGHRISMLLEPRGWFPTAIQVEGLVCRVVNDINTESKNLVRHLGVKFGKVDETNKVAFLELLKDILERLKRAQ